MAGDGDQSEANSGGQGQGDGASGQADSNRLKVVRRQWKAAITRHLGTLECLMAEDSYDEVLDRLKVIKNSFAQLEEAHDSYINSLTTLSDDELLQNEQWLSEVQGNYTAGVRAARQWLKDNGQLVSVDVKPTVKCDIPPPPCGSVKSDNTELIDMLSIPKLELDKFDGNPLEYHSFINVFDENVGNKTSDDRVKLTRLLQYTTGSAKAAIRNCTLISGSAGYKQARDILHTRFGNDHLISRKIVSDLTDGKLVSKSCDIRKLADDLGMACSTLDDLKTTYEIDNQNTIIQIAQRCPKSIQTKWKNKALDTKRETGLYPRFAEVVSFMRKIANDWCDPVYGGPTLSLPNVKSTSVNSFTAESSVSASSKSAPEPTQNCVACGQAHRLIYCDVFKAMKPADRFQLVKQKRLCFTCLISNHVVAKCKSPYVCPVANCGKRHSKFIHTDVTPGANGSSNVSVGGATGGSGNSVTNGSTIAFGNSVYLPIVPLCVNGVKVFALLDTGSTNTFITASLAKRLNLSGYQHNYVMKTVSRVKPTCSKVVEINLSAVDGSFAEDICNVLVETSIPAKYPMHDIDVSKYPHLSDLPITPVDQGSPVEVLIGMDNSHLILPLEVRRNPRSLKDPYATRSVFGWALNGRVGDGDIGEITSLFVQLDEKVERLWQMENDMNDTGGSYSVEDREVIDLWEREIKQENGHYVLPIPWRNGCANLPNNKCIAEHRLNGLTKRLDKTGMTEVYDQNIQKLVQNGYAERVPENELNRNDGSVWYIPHHPVFKPGKVRPVFDCSARYKGVSLNGECMQGPNLTNNLVHVLLRFRQFKYAIMADVESMYLQVRIPDADRNALRFLWYDEGNLTEFRMTSHLFGGVWCASSSGFALRHTVNDFNPSPLIKDTVLRSFYVDDMLKSVKTVEEACDVICITKQVLSQGGFNLTKFVVNDSVLLDRIDERDRAKDIKEIVPDIYCKALGIQWEVNSDTFHYKYSANEQQTCTNRRRILSRISSMYDPLGLISPVVLQGKILFQEATRQRLSWDEPVSPGLLTKWQTWLESMQWLENIKFDRCVVPPDFTDGVFELHHFSDASLAGYGACSYLRIINKDGRVHVALLMSKARLAPIKQTTVPRLELSAAVVAVKLDHLIRRELELPLLMSQFWSDSQIVIAYIRNETKRFKTFVANRVSQIHQLSEPRQWHFVPGDDNPADVLSRGCTAENIPDIWRHGPEFLWDYKCNWPQLGEETNIAPDDLEICKPKSETRGCAVHTVVSDNTFEHPMSALMGYYRMQKVVSWLRRFMRYLKDKQVETGPVTCSEMRDAELCVLRYVQSSVYANEIRDLKADGKVKKSSSLYSLSPVLDNDLIVIGSRLSNAPISHRSKAPIILPSDHKISNMIVSEYHGYCHLGTEWVLSRLRMRYWIIKARSLIKRTKHRCAICKRLYAAPMLQKMAELPIQRCQPDFVPFAFVGVDIFGPFYVTVGRASAKRYGCVYSCFNSRAIHIEKVDDLSTDAFINGFVRFVARRGQPRYVRSDNGTNLVGAYNELARSFKQLSRDKIIQAARRRDIEWVFNPPLASHHGGSWERMIRTIRRVLYAILHSSVRLSDDVLNTVFCEAENIVNSRPMTKVSDDATDSEPLTPNHLLMLKGNFSYPWTNVKDGNMYQRKWRHVQYFANLFWKRWVREYLPELHRRQKWLNEMPNVRKDDVVLIMDENSPRGSWPLARVNDVITGRDGLVRSVKLETKSTKLVRPITKIVSLECRDM